MAEVPAPDSWESEPFAIPCFILLITESPVTPAPTLLKENAEAKEIIRKLLQDIEIAENEYKFTLQTAIRAERFLKEFE